MNLQITGAGRHMRLLRQQQEHLCTQRRETLQSTLPSLLGSAGEHTRLPLEGIAPTGTATEQGRPGQHWSQKQTSRRSTTGAARAARSLCTTRAVSVEEAGPALSSRAGLVLPPFPLGG